jgi:hypothetical protein
MMLLLLLPFLLPTPHPPLLPPFLPSTQGLNDVPQGRETLVDVLRFFQGNALGTGL